MIYLPEELSRFEALPLPPDEAREHGWGLDYAGVLGSTPPLTNGLAGAGVEIRARTEPRPTIRGKAQATFLTT